MTDDDLAADRDRELVSKLDRLNREFYSADPADYFDVRLLALMLLAGRPDDVLALLADGVTYGHVHAEVTGGKAGAEGVRDFASMESQVLLHQVCEALIRLFLAHVGRPQCPWLEVAGERDFASFKQRVHEELLDRPARSLHADVADVFLGGPAGVAEDRWPSAVANLTMFLRVFARRWLEDAFVYNSLKHGLAVVPSAADMRFFAEGSPDAHRLGGGPSLAYLESAHAPPDGRTWKMTTLWIDVSESLAFTQVARGMVGSLWEVARVRYVDSSRVPVLFIPPVDLTPDKLRTTDRLPAKRWTIGLGIETRPNR